MAPRTSIHLEWDGVARMRHKITGQRCKHWDDDVLAWVLSPSAPLLLANQFGVMKPSHGLIVSGWVIDMLFHNRYTLMPINSALSSARIDFIYTSGSSVKLTFHPRHPFFANSDSLEEGVRQLINNYTHYVYSKLDDYLKIVFRTIATIAIGTYYDFLQDIVATNHRQSKERWSLAFSAFSAPLVQYLSGYYYVPQGGRNPENEDWARKQTDDLSEQLSELTSMRDSLFTAFGLR